LVVLCLFVPPKSFGQSTVTCNSNDEKRHSCAADTRGGVQLQSQQSGSPCTEGYSWGSDNNGIWVDHGCRAKFAVGGYNRNRDYGNGGYGNTGNGQAQTVTCNSDDEKRHYCAADTRGGVRLQSQQSGSPCTEGYSWGYDSQRIWVDRGCRANFAIGGGRGRYGDRNNRNNGRNDGEQNGDNQNRDYGNRGYGNTGNGQTQVVACNSNDEKRHSCAADTRGGVQLQSQQSGSPCTQGYSWGYDDRGIWVDHGCRANFTVGAGSSRNRSRQRRQWNPNR
jgi:hypothetical protein